MGFIHETGTRPHVLRFGLLDTASCARSDGFVQAVASKLRICGSAKAEGLGFAICKPEHANTQISNPKY